LVPGIAPFHHSATDWGFQAEDVVMGFQSRQGSAGRWSGGRYDTPWQETIGVTCTADGQRDIAGSWRLFLGPVVIYPNCKVLSGRLRGPIRVLLGRRTTSRQNPVQLMRRSSAIFRRLIFRHHASAIHRTKLCGVLRCSMRISSSPDAEGNPYFMWFAAGP